MIRRRVAAAACGLAVVAGVAIAGCGDGYGRVTGVVVEVDGDLTSIRAFTVQAPEGRFVFEPGPELTAFEDGAPISHLADHLRSGTPVEVTYRGDGDPYTAVAVADSDTDG